MSIYNIDIVEIIQIVNPTPRGALPVGDIAVNAVYANQALANEGLALHRLKPFEVLDKVGFLKTGDEAAELLLDALAAKVALDMANGGGFINLTGALEED